MGYTETYCQTTGSNLNAGSTATDAATFTYASGSWVASTGVFTVAAGNPLSDGVAVGDFASVYPDGSSVAVFIGRVTARDATTIAVSLAAKSGTAPADGTSNRTLSVGGAWKGPNAAVSFPFGFVQNTMTNTAGEQVRVNFKNAANYAVTAAMTHSPTSGANILFQGYTTTPGDLGKAIIDGGAAGAAYVVLTMGANATSCSIVDFIFSNNGATGVASLVTNSSAVNTTWFRCVFTGSRGSGFTNGGTGVNVIECEAYGNNTSNTASLAGFLTSTNARHVRCIAHDNAGSNSNGFLTSTATAEYIDCVADTNGRAGFNASGSCMFMSGCDVYNNAGSGFLGTAALTTLYAENCNFVKNGAWGIETLGTLVNGRILNCGFGGGADVNVGGNISALKGVVEVGSVTYTTHPWSAPTTGDFRITHAQAKGAGRGAFTQTAASYTGHIAYPDIGSGQHQDTGSGGLIGAGSLSGGFQ